MKKMPFMLILVFALAPSTVMSAEKHLKGAVYSPEQGVICDKKAGLCADQMGISLALTRE